jgi:hypothetical protein
MDGSGNAPGTLRTRRRTAIAGGSTLGLHGVLLWLATMFSGGDVRPAPGPAALTSVEIVEPPVPPPPPPPETPGPGKRQDRAAANTLGTRGRRGHDAPTRSPTRPVPTPDPLDELTVRYDAPTSETPGNPAGTSGRGLGAGLSGTGLGGGGLGDGFGAGNGIGSLSIPPPPPETPSLARPPRPRYDYSHWPFRAPPGYSGGSILVELTIDPHGVVKNVRMITHAEPSIDQRAAQTARGFEFDPALDRFGSPTWGRHRWEFVVSRAPYAKYFHFGATM